MRLIDVESVMDKVDECFDSCDQLDVHFTAQDVIDIIKDAPIVEVKPTIYAHWITMSDKCGTFYCCSNCGEDLPRHFVKKPSYDDLYGELISIDKTSFCPNCGAIMNENDE